MSCYIVLYFRLKYKGQLQSYSRKFKETGAEIEDLLKKITSFTVNNSGLEQKKVALKGLENQRKQLRSKVEKLPEIDNNLREKLLQCEKVLNNYNNYFIEVYLHITLN